MMSVSELYNYIKANLLELYPDSSERLAFARRLFSNITGFSQQEVVMNPGRIVDIQESRLDDVWERVRKHEPLEYIFNSAQFLDLELFTDGLVLIPRPETEELVMMVSNYLRSSGKRLSLLDIGTGSGCIPISLALLYKLHYYTAFDISDAALATARRNAAKYGCDIDFRRIDILNWESYDIEAIAADNGKYDVIISNPPYVMDSERVLMQANVLDYEPHSALFVPDSDPLVFYREISRFAVRFLNNNGMLFFEINERLGKETATLMEDCGFSDVAVVKDLFGKDRFAVGNLIY